MLRTSPLLLLLAACATADDLGPAEFGTGSPEELARAEDLAYAALFDVDGAAARGGIDELRTIRVRVDDLAMAHTHVQQLQDGVPVWGAEAIVHLNPDGSLASVTNDLVGIPQVDTAPAYAAAGSSSGRGGSPGSATS